MYKTGLLTLGLIGTLFITSCIKHEVIPAPEPQVDLDAHFEGLVGGSFIEYTENVDGYYGLSELATQSAGGVSNAQYTFSMISAEAGTIKSLPILFTTSVRLLRNKPAKAYSDNVSGTGVTAPKIVAGSAPKATDTG